MPRHHYIFEVHYFGGWPGNRIALRNLIIEWIDYQQKLVGTRTNSSSMVVKLDGFDFAIQTNRLPMLASFDIPQLHNFIQPT
jgi:hypothetical protein